MNDANRTFGAAIAELFEELDWQLLGNCYCEGDGREFFDEELRERILDTGLMLADDVARAVGTARGRSLYLGAEIAELPLILAEHLVLGRSVEWSNVDGPAVRELVRALDVVGSRLAVVLPQPRVLEPKQIEPSSCDHLWMVSVLTDPDSFPALHDALYERTDGPLATSRGALAEERVRAHALIDGWLDCAAQRCVVTTTDEERTLIQPRVDGRGWSLAFPSAGRISAIVGDQIRIGLMQRSTV